MMTLDKIEHVVTVSLVGCVVLFLCLVGSARGAQLRYIRIGEHEGFTRIVFELRGSAAFEKPQVRGKGKLSVVLLDTTTSLPGKISIETTKRVDAIEFVQQDMHLATHVTFPFPYFRLKPFTLSNPERLVLDIYRMNTPPEDAVVVESVQKASERVLVGADERKAIAKLRRAPREPAVKPPEVPDRHTDKPAAQETQRSSQRPLQETAIPSPALSKETGTLLAKRPKPVPDTEGASVNHSLQHSPWQTYPLAILIILSVIIVALLSFIIFQKRRGPGSRYAGETLEATSKAGEGMEALDRRIKDAFRKFDQS
jgi:hypothetical protein